MDLGLKGLIAVVVGGSSGIGAATVQTLAREGCDVLFCGRNPQKIDALVERLKGSLPVDAGEVRGEVVDITNRDHLETWFAKMDKADIVISTVSALSPDWETSWQADVTGTLNVLAVAEAKLKQSKVGAFTYVGSKASSFATPGFESYGACKAAMAHVVKSTAIRLAAEGVRMNVVSPGDTFEEGGFWDNIRTNAPDVYQQTLAGNPFGRLATPQEIAQTVAFISSPLASFVSGANWYVDGASTNQVQV